MRAVVRTPVPGVYCLISAAISFARPPDDAAGKWT
jgi:hypothetical protein